VQATLKPARQLELERLLRGAYGLPSAGVIVRSVDAAAGEPYPYRPALVANDSFMSTHLAASATTGGAGSVPCLALGPDLGRVVERWWSLPTDGAVAWADFHTKLVTANVLVRVTRASICHSDRRVLAGQKPGDKEAMGHEGGGYVVDPRPLGSEINARA